MSQPPLFTAAAPPEVPALDTVAQASTSPTALALLAAEAGGGAASAPVPDALQRVYDACGRSKDAAVAAAEAVAAHEMASANLTFLLERQAAAAALRSSQQALADLEVRSRQVILALSRRYVALEQELRELKFAAAAPPAAAAALRAPMPPQYKRQLEAAAAASPAKVARRTSDVSGERPAMEAEAASPSAAAPLPPPPPPPPPLPPPVKSEAEVDAAAAQKAADLERLLSYYTREEIEVRPGEPQTVMSTRRGGGRDRFPPRRCTRLQTAAYLGGGLQARVEALMASGEAPQRAAAHALLRAIERSETAGAPPPDGRFFGGAAPSCELSDDEDVTLVEAAAAAADAIDLTGEVGGAEGPPRPRRASGTPGDPPGEPIHTALTVMAEEGVKSLLRALPPWDGFRRGEDIFRMVQERWTDAEGTQRVWATSRSTRDQLRRALNGLQHVFAKSDPDQVTGQLSWCCLVAPPVKLEE